MLSLLWQLYTYNGKSGNWHLFLCYCRYFDKSFYWNVSGVVLFQAYEFCPNHWFWLVAVATKRLNFHACNSYSIWAEYRLHSCTFRWALWPMGLWFYYHSPALKKWGLYWICLVLPEFCDSVIIQMKLEYLWGQLANVDQILYEASLGWGKGCLWFWDRLYQSFGFHGNRKRPLTYNGENDVSTFSLLFFIRFFSNLQVARTGIKSQTSSNFCQIGPLPTELGALEHLKNFP